MYPASCHFSTDIAPSFELPRAVSILMLRPRRQGRYNLGLALIVELSQSQLNQTQAEIENLSARYDYQSQYQALQYTIGQLR